MRGTTTTTTAAAAAVAAVAAAGVLWGAAPGAAYTIQHSVELPGECNAERDRQTANPWRDQEEFNEVSLDGFFLDEDFTVPNGAEWCFVAMAGQGGSGADGDGVAGGSGCPAYAEIDVTPGEVLHFTRPTAVSPTQTQTGVGLNGSAFVMTGDNGETPVTARGGIAGAYGGGGCAGGGSSAHYGLGGRGGQWGFPGTAGFNHTQYPPGPGPIELGWGNASACRELRPGSSANLLSSQHPFSVRGSSFGQLNAPNDYAGGSGGIGLYWPPFTSTAGYGSLGSSVSGRISWTAGGGPAGGVDQPAGNVATGGRGAPGVAIVRCFTNEPLFCKAPPSPTKVARHSELFTTPGSHTFTAPAGLACTRMRAMVIGGGSTGYGQPNAGGASGQLVAHEVPGVRGGGSVPVTVGAGGYFSSETSSGYYAGQDSFFGDLRAGGGTLNGADGPSGNVGGESGTSWQDPGRRAANGTNDGSDGSGTGLNRRRGQGDATNCTTAFTNITIELGAVGIGSLGIGRSGDYPTYYYQMGSGGGGGAGWMLNGQEPTGAREPRTTPGDVNNCTFPGADRGANARGYGAGGTAASSCRRRAPSYAYWYGGGGDGRSGAVYVECFFDLDEAPGFVEMRVRVLESAASFDGQPWVNLISLLMNLDSDRVLIYNVSEVTPSAVDVDFFVLDVDPADVPPAGRLRDRRQQATCAREGADLLVNAAQTDLDNTGLTTTRSREIVADNSAPWCIGVSTTGSTGGSPPSPPPPSTTGTGPAPSSPPPPSSPADAGDGGESSGGGLVDAFPVEILLAAVGGIACLLLCIGIGVGCLISRRNKGGRGRDSSDDIQMNVPSAVGSVRGFESVASGIMTPVEGGSATYSSMPSGVASPSSAGGGALYAAFDMSGVTTALRQDSMILDPTLLKSEDVELGRGEFGVVYKGTYDGKEVAIKHLLKAADSSAMDEFMGEADLMAQIPKHENVLQFIGLATVSAGGTPAIVTEFCAGSSLLNAVRHAPLEEGTLWFVVRGVAAGMRHLSANGVIHRDLACRNVLLDSSWSPKICDFGMSRITAGDSQESTKSDTGPLKWMAPEALEHRQYSEKSDIWMFGCTVIEAITRKEPYPELSAMELGTQVILRKLQIQAPSDCPAAMKPTIDACFAYDANDRPTFAEVCQRLNP